MFDKELILTILIQIDTAIETIAFRFCSVCSTSDFIDSPQGMEKLDSICMLFIAVGESLKQIDKITDCELLATYPTIDWKGVKGLRDIVSHHYFDVDVEEIFYLCKNELPKLSQTIKQMIGDLQK